MAFVIDRLLLFATVFVAAAGIGIVLEILGVAFSAPSTPASSAAAPLSPFSVVAFAIDWILVPMIFALKDGFAGYSPGKWLMGVRVVDRHSRQPIGFRQSFMRNLILMIPVLPLVVAVQLISGRRLGDGWANTEVIWVKRKHTLPFEPNDQICHSCGYDLTGNVSGVCPECGVAAPMSSQDAAPPAGQPLSGHLR